MAESVTLPAGVEVKPVRPGTEFHRLTIQPGKTVTNVGARTVNYDEEGESSPPTDTLTTGQSLDVDVVTTFYVDAGKGTVAVADTDNRTVFSLDDDITPTQDLRDDANAAAIVAYVAALSNAISDGSGVRTAEVADA